MELSSVETLAMVIIQPSDGDCTPAIWTQPEKVLDGFERGIYDAIDRAEENPSDGSNAVAGSACRFCPAEAICPVKTGQVAAALRVTPEQAQQLAEALPQAADLESWIKAVRKLAHEQAELGVKIPNHKLVNKRARRVWTDEGLVGKKIRAMRNMPIAEAQDIKLKTAPALEKVFKQKGLDFDKLSAYIASVSSGTTLVHETDKREEALPVGSLKLTLDALN